MGDNTKHLPTDRKCKQEEEKELETDQRVELVSGITYQEILSKGKSKYVDNCENILTNENVPTNSAEVNESASVGIDMPIEDIVTTTTEVEICSKEHDEPNKALTETRETDCYSLMQKVYTVLKEPKDLQPIEGILQHDEATKLMAQIKPTRILFPSSHSVTVKEFSDTGDLKNSEIPLKVVQPSITIASIEKNRNDKEGNVETDICEQAETDSTLKANISSTTNTNSNTISTRGFPNPSRSSIYPTGLICKKMVVKNTSGVISAGIEKTTVDPQQFTLTPTSIRSRKIIAINKNKLTPIRYKIQSCVLLPSDVRKPNTTANDKPVITSVEYVPKKPLLGKSTYSKSLNYEKTNCVDSDDFDRDDLSITTDSSHTENSDELPMEPKLKQPRLFHSKSIPTLTPAYLKSLSAYIEEAKSAHKAAIIELKDSSIAKDPTNKDESLETLVTKKSINKHISEQQLLLDKSAREGNTSTGIALTESNTEDGDEKNHNEQCEVVEEEKMEITDCDRIHRERVKIDQKALVDQNNSTEYSTNESDNKEVDESHSSKVNLKLCTDSETSQIEAENIRKIEKEREDSIESDDVQHKDFQVEEQTADQKNVTECYASLHEDEHETECTQSIPVVNKTFNNVFSKCVKSNKSYASTQTDDSTMKLLENISTLRKKVRKQAEEIVSLNAAMKLLDTASLLKTFDNF